MSAIRRGGGGEQRRRNNIIKEDGNYGRNEVIITKKIWNSKAKNIFAEILFWKKCRLIQKPNDTLFCVVFQFILTTDKQWHLGGVARQSKGKCLYLVAEWSEWVKTDKVMTSDTSTDN